MPEKLSTTISIRIKMQSLLDIQKLQDNSEFKSINAYIVHLIEKHVIDSREGESSKKKKKKA